MRVPPGGCSARIFLHCSLLPPRISALCNRRRPPFAAPSPIAASNSNVVLVSSPIATLRGGAISDCSARRRASGPCPAHLTQSCGNLIVRHLSGPVRGSARSEPTNAPAPPPAMRGHFPQRVLGAISNCTKLVGGWVII